MHTRRDFACNGLDCDRQGRRAPAWNDGRDLREPPFVVYRAAIDADPAQY